MAKFVPSLQNICIEFIKRTDIQQLIISRRSIPPVEHEYNSMVSRILALIEKFNGNVYGGFARDMVAKLIFNDIDVRFPYDTDVEKFIAALRENNFQIQTAKPEYGYKKINVYDKSSGYLVNMDLSFSEYFTKHNSYDSFYKKRMVRHGPFDFDVNRLKLVLKSNIYNSYDFPDWHFEEQTYTVLFLHDYHIPSVDYQDLQRTIDHCQRHEFVVLDADSKATTVHFDRSQCIRHDSNTGRKLLARIDKMQARGWKMLNEPCNNPACILAPPNLVWKYWRTKAIQKLVCQRIGQKKRHFREKVENIRTAPEPDSVKSANEKSYERRRRARQKYQAKKHAGNRR